MQFKPINDMYALIDEQLAQDRDRDEQDARKRIENDWKICVAKSENVRNELLN